MQNILRVNTPASYAGQGVEGEEAGDEEDEDEDEDEYGVEVRSTREYEHNTLQHTFSKTRFGRLLFWIVQAMTHNAWLGSHMGLYLWGIVWTISLNIARQIEFSKRFLKHNIWALRI